MPPQPHPVLRDSRAVAVTKRQDGELGLVLELSGTDELAALLTDARARKRRKSFPREWV